MRRSFVLYAVVLSVGVSLRATNAATIDVQGFGQNGWYSWDTRDTSGNQLVGTNDTHPYGPTYFGVPASAASDTAIGKQIIFMGEGQTVNTADGNPPPGASPIGSLGGLGYVRLDGTSSNSGKSDISYVDQNGVAPGSALQLANFGLSYTYYIENNPTFRTLGLNISLVGNDSRNYTFSHVQDGSAQPTAAAGWNTESIDTNTGLFGLFVSGVGPVGPAKTLANWALDPTYGSFMFSGSAEVYRVGFNIGSGQRQSEQYLDYMSTNLLNNGGTIDFQAPEPGSLALMGIFGVAATIRRRRRAA